MLREAAIGEFGESLFEHALFYNYENSLRFELSTSGSALDMFLQAFSKANEIVDDTLAEADDLYACVGCYCSGSNFCVRSTLLSISELGVKLPSGREYWVVPEPDEEDYFRAFLLFPIGRDDVRRLIWGAVASDLGIRPVLNGWVYLYSLTRKVLIHPYDDRGMDVVGDRDRLRGMYRKYNDWLSDYDRESMNASFGTDF
jgi:hypothetical protein